MTERLLQFIWQFGYFNNTNLTTAEGEKISILFAGNLNSNGGPDFSAAKIRIGETTFFGSVELHLKTSDWEKHGHEGDRQYGNVILHVVYRHDKPLPHAIPVLELEPRISSLLLERYTALLQTESFIPCDASVASVPELVWMAWKERLLAERLTRKAQYILDLLEQSNQHWEETFWWLLARNFGMKVNSDAFEAVARSLSINLLAKHKHSIHQVEALLFGQAGLLQTTFEDDYPRMLQREFHFLQKKMSLQPVSVPLQFLRMRPGNFPTIRLSQLAALIQQSSHLFSKVLEAEKLSEVSALFDVTANDFWHYHYTFHLASPFKPKTLGADSIQNILINTVAPVLFAYGLHHGQETYKEKALRWLGDLPAEKNTITKGFSLLGLKAKTAFDSQAQIELKNEFCSVKKCLQCAVGNSLLKREAYRAAAPSLKK
ncbi:DUF2851 family protein [Flavisolibacter sp. BT320]|nr:DUF2851 family protein [Flavisolibacter longurius]